MSINRPPTESIPDGHAGADSGVETGNLPFAVAPVVIPVLKEELEVRIQQVVTGTVRIRKIVHEREEFVEEPAVRSTFDIERIPVNKVVDAPPQVRQEGETTIFPVMEEVLVVTKQLLLKEEVRITKRVSEFSDRQRILLRTEELIIDRDSTNKSSN